MKCLRCADAIGRAALTPLGGQIRKRKHRKFSFEQQPVRENVRTVKFDFERFEVESRVQLRLEIERVLRY